MSPASFVACKGNVSLGYAQTVIGRFNKPENTLFTIGAGVNDTTRKNVFSVLSDSYNAKFYIGRGTDTDSAYWATDYPEFYVGTTLKLYGSLSAAGSLLAYGDISADIGAVYAYKVFASDTLTSNYFVTTNGVVSNTLTATNIITSSISSLVSGNETQLIMDYHSSTGAIHVNVGLSANNAGISGSYSNPGGSWSDSIGWYDIITKGNWLKNHLYQEDLLQLGGDSLNSTTANNTYNPQLRLDWGSATVQDSTYSSTAPKILFIGGNSTTSYNCTAALTFSYYNTPMRFGSTANHTSLAGGWFDFTVSDVGDKNAGVMADCFSAKSGIFTNMSGNLTGSATSALTSKSALSAGSAKSAGTASSALSADCVHWSKGTDDAYRPIGFANAGSSASYTAGNAFNNTMVYDNSFNYNPTHRLLQVGNARFYNSSTSGDTVAIIRGKSYFYRGNSVNLNNAIHSCITEIFMCPTGSTTQTATIGISSCLEDYYYTVINIHNVNNSYTKATRIEFTGNSNAYTWVRPGGSANVPANSTATIAIGGQDGGQGLGWATSSKHITIMYCRYGNERLLFTNWL